MSDASTPGAARVAPEPPYGVIDRYELIEQRWQDGLATVWIGRTCDRTARLVEIVHLDPYVARVPEFREGFLRDANALRNTSHTSFCGFHTAGVSSGAGFATRPYLEAISLAELLERAATAGDLLPPPCALRIALDLTGALKAIQSAADGPLMHGDVTPANVLLTPDGSVLLAQSGLALAAARADSVQAPGRNPRIGYKAPEQLGSVTGEALNLDGRADVFALGVVLWEAIAGRTLFDATTDAEIVQQVLRAPIPPLDGSLPNGLASVIAATLERDASRRLAGPAEFSDALRKFSMIAHSNELATWILRHGRTAIEKRRAKLAALAPSSGTPPTPPQAAAQRPTLRIGKGTRQLGEPQQVSEPLGPTYVAPTEVPKSHLPATSEPEAKVVLNIPTEAGKAVGDAVLATRERRRAATIRLRNPLADDGVATLAALGRTEAAPPATAALAHAPPQAGPMTLSTKAVMRAADNVVAPPFDVSLDALPKRRSRATVLVIGIASMLGAAAFLGRGLVLSTARTDATVPKAPPVQTITSADNRRAQPLELPQSAAEPAAATDPSPVPNASASSPARSGSAPASPSNLLGSVPAEQIAQDSDATSGSTAKTLPRHATPRPIKTAAPSAPVRPAKKPNAEIPSEI